MNEKRAELADRIRAVLADEPTLEQKRMFGSLAFMINGRLLAAAWGSGSLFLRVDPERSEELQRLPGVEIAVMGQKSMGPSWLTVDAEYVADDGELLFWVDVAREFNASLAA